MYIYIYVRTFILKGKMLTNNFYLFLNKFFKTVRYKVKSSININEINFTYFCLSLNMYLMHFKVFNICIYYFHTHTYLCLHVLNAFRIIFSCQFIIYFACITTSNHIFFILHSFLIAKFKLPSLHLINTHSYLP